MVGVVTQWYRICLMWLQYLAVQKQKTNTNNNKNRLKKKKAIVEKIKGNGVQNHTSKYLF